MRLISVSRFCARKNQYPAAFKLYNTVDLIASFKWTCCSTIETPEHCHGRNERKKTKTTKINAEHDIVDAIYRQLLSLSHHKLDIQSYVYIFFGFKWKLKCNIWTGCDYNFYFCRTYLHRSITDKIYKLNHFFRWYISVHDKRPLASFHAKAAHGHKIFHSLEQGFSHFRLAASRNHVIDSQYFMLEIFFK